MATAGRRMKRYAILNILLLDETGNWSTGFECKGDPDDLFDESQYVESVE